jgi:hypothetical protein
MRTLELKDICGYLPHGLYCLNCDDMIEEIEFDNVGNLMRGIDLQDEAEDDEWVASQQYKPVLRPLSDLYRTIIHTGKEIIPIMGIRKIINDFEYDFLDIKEELNVDRSTLIDLFDFLNELKIDYRQLLDNELAVSVYDIKVNPYK